MYLMCSRQKKWTAATDVSTVHQEPPQGNTQTPVPQQAHICINAEGSWKLETPAPDTKPTKKLDSDEKDQDLWDHSKDLLRQKKCLKIYYQEQSSRAVHMPLHEDEG